jgi:hypothetical protein
MKHILTLKTINGSKSNMSNVQSRIVNVIQTEQGDEITYFTLEGVMIGGFKGGTRQTPELPETPVEKPKGEVVTAPKPSDIKRDKEREVEESKTAEGRLKHLKRDIA